jgi:mannose/cellobiose epimerase-like protein (N-acyl-D-glucosamine 2-epimerase family)
MASRPSTLLEPGHEAEWAEINREEDEYRRAAARALTASERIARGQKLSQQAVSLLAASIRAGHVPRRALWS